MGNIPQVPQQHEQVMVRQDPPVKTTTDWLTLILAALGALKLILAAPPFEYELPQLTVDAWANMISLAFTGYGIWRNTYVSRTAKQQKDVLQQVGLKDPNK